MKRYIIQRTLKLIPTIIGIFVILFFVYTAMPGNYVDTLTPGLHTTQAQLDRITRKYNLDSSKVQKFCYWIKDFLDGKLKMYQEHIKGDPIYITPIVFKMAKYNIIFIGLVILFGILISIPIGAGGILRNKKKENKLSKWIIWICASVPSFLIAGIFVKAFFESEFFFHYALYKNPIQAAKLKNLLVNSIIPFVILSIIYIPKLAGTIKVTMEDISKKEYITTSRAYGVSNRKIKYKYVLKNIIIPVATFVGMSYSSIFSESILIQSVIGSNGLGSFLFSSVLARQYDAMMACLIVIIVIVVISNYLADIAYLLDPRFRKSLDK